MSNDQVLVKRQSVYASSNQAERKLKKELKEKRVKGGDISSGDFLGPWAPYEGEEDFKEVNELTEEQKEILKKMEEDREKKLEEMQNEDVIKSSSIFHGKERYDYQGRSFVLPPTNFTLSSGKPNYIPKKPLHVYKGHHQGVLNAQFFPKYGHFILSSSFDHTVKLWDVYNDRKCMMTYMGHKGAVKDL